MEIFSEQTGHGHLSFSFWAIDSSFGGTFGLSKKRVVHLHLRLSLICDRRNEWIFPQLGQAQKTVLSRSCWELVMVVAAAMFRGARSHFDVLSFGELIEVICGTIHDCRHPSMCNLSEYRRCKVE